MNPWDKQDDETPRAFHAFTHYRDLGISGRSLDKAYYEHETVCGRKPVETTSKSRGRWWLRWSQDYRWRDRAAAYDAAIDQQKQAVMAQEREDGWKRIQVTARILFQKFVEGIKAREASGLSTSELIRAAETAAKLELQVIERKSIEAGADKEPVDAQPQEIHVKVTHDIGTASGVLAILAQAGVLGAHPEIMSGADPGDDSTLH